MGGVDSGFDVLFVHFRESGEFVEGGRVDDVEGGFAGKGGDPLAVDEPFGLEEGFVLAGRRGFWIGWPWWVVLFLFGLYKAGELTYVDKREVGDCLTVK